MPAGKHAKMHDSTPDCVTASCGIHPSIHPFLQAMKQLRHPKQSISPSTTKINAGGITQVLAARPRRRIIRWQFVRDTMPLRHPSVHHSQLPYSMCPLVRMYSSSSHPNTSPFRTFCSSQFCSFSVLLSLRILPR